MFRRSTSLVTLAAFVLSSVSCSPYKRVATSPEDVRRGGTTVEVKAVVTTSGERAEFSNAITARVDGDRLVWDSRTPERVSDRDTRPTVRIAAAGLVGVEAPQPGATVRMEIRTTGGIGSSGNFTSQRDGTLKGRLTSVAVPLSAVQQIEVQERDSAKLALLIVGVSALAFLAVVGLMIAANGGIWGDSSPLGAMTSPR